MVNQRFVDATSLCKEIEEFQTFNRSDIWNIDMLDIVNSSLSKIPDLDDWYNLVILNWIGYRHSDCRELEGWSIAIFM